jgi:uncharacterized protein (DUF885 family)
MIELERIADEVLGASFDIKGFHDLVLSSGPLPLAVLDGVVAAWSKGTQ